MTLSNAPSRSGSRSLRSVILSSACLWTIAASGCGKPRRSPPVVERAIHTATSPSTGVVDRAPSVAEQKSPLNAKNQCYTWSSSHRDGTHQDNLVAFAIVNTSYARGANGRDERQSHRQIWKVTCAPNLKCRGVLYDLANWDAGKTSTEFDIYSVEGRVTSRGPQHWLLEFGTTKIRVDLDATTLTVDLGDEGHGVAECPDRFAEDSRSARPLRGEPMAL